MTPDSFSDGGQFFTLDSAMSHAEKMIGEGADIIDIGGESTRPGAQPVSVDQEVDRVLPVVQKLRQHFDVAISVDTCKSEVMRSVVDEDIDLINDVLALRADGAMGVMAATDTPVCLMHMQGEPRTMQVEPTYTDVVEDIKAFFNERTSTCESSGIGSNRILLDVGFGFGKTPAHNLTLINQLTQFLDFNLPLLVGLSRKSTIGKITEDRLTGSLSGALAAVKNGAKVLRVHDVAQTVEALKVWCSIDDEQVFDWQTQE